MQAHARAAVDAACISDDPEHIARSKRYAQRTTARTRTSFGSAFLPIFRLSSYTPATAAWLEGALP